MPNKQYLTTREAAEYSGISMGTLANWRSQGRGPQYRKIGRKITYNIDELEDWLITHRVFTADCDFVD